MSAHPVPTPLPNYVQVALNSIPFLPTTLTTETAYEAAINARAVIRALYAYKDAAEAIVADDMQEHGGNERLIGGALFTFKSDGWSYPDVSRLVSVLADHLAAGRITEDEFSDCVVEVRKEPEFRINSRLITNLIDKRGLSDLAALRIRTKPRLSVKEK